MYLNKTGTYRGRWTYEHQYKMCECVRLNITFVEFQVCRAGHRPVSQPTYLPQVQLPYSGVVGAGGSSHSVWLPHHGVHPSISQHDLHPPCKSLGSYALVWPLVRDEKSSLVPANTGDLKDKIE